jgi:hypothetical protein
MMKIYGVYGDLMQSLVELVRLFQPVKGFLRPIAITEDY